MICIRFIMAASLAALCGLPATAGAAAASEEIYVSTGEHGEVSFSDEAGPGAERVVLETTEPAEDPMAELERRIAQTLAVANALEEARLEREQARAQARAAEAEARAQPQVVYQDRYVSSPYLYPRPFRPGRRHKPPHGPPPGGPEQPAPPAEETISKSFPMKD
jgi:hypothetical protein